LAARTSNSRKDSLNFRPGLPPAGVTFFRGNDDVLSWQCTSSTGPQAIGSGWPRQRSQPLLKKSSFEPVPAQLQCFQEGLARLIDATQLPHRVGASSERKIARNEFIPIQAPLHQFAISSVQDANASHAKWEQWFPRS